jgi:hypothetical protein
MPTATTGSSHRLPRRPGGGAPPSGGQESVAGKLMFRSAFKRNRCIIPASGYVEWKTMLDGKQPYFISAAEAHHRRSVGPVAPRTVPEPEAVGGHCRLGGAAQNRGAGLIGATGGGCRRADDRQHRRDVGERRRPAVFAGGIWVRGILDHDQRRPRSALRPFVLPKSDFGRFHRHCTFCFVPTSTSWHTVN